MMSRTVQIASHYYILALLLVICAVSAQVQTPVEVNQPHPPQPLPSNSPVQMPNLMLNYCNVSTTKPAPETTKYTFKSCIVAQFAAYLSLGQGKYIPISQAKVNETSSLCDAPQTNTTSAQDPLLVIDFSCGSLSLAIGHTNDSKTYVKNISGLYHLKEKESNTFSNSSGAFYTTQSGHYYKCNSEQPIVIGQDQNLMLSNFALEAYRTVTTTDYYQIPEECALDSQPVSDLVRIGVGVCLVALVAIVLIAYFIGRRRWSERSSYESV